MPRNVVVDATEQVACPKCGHDFLLSEGGSKA